MCTESFPAVVLLSWLSTSSLPNLDLDLRLSQYAREERVGIRHTIVDYLWEFQAKYLARGTCFTIN